MAGARLASPPNKGGLRSVPGETPRIPPQPRMPRAGHRDRSTASIDHRHRKIPPAFASNHLRSIRHNGIRKAANLARFLEPSSLASGITREQKRRNSGPATSLHGSTITVFIGVEGPFWQRFDVTSA